MKRLRWAGLLIAVSLLLGCRDRGIPLPTSPVSGKVLYNGKPLGFGRIAFFHHSGHAKSADIAQDGSFSLVAYQGKNAISVECFDTDRPGSAKPRSFILGENKSLIPDRYMSYGTSGLTFEVKSTDNKAEFVLKD